MPDNIEVQEALEMDIDEAKEIISVMDAFKRLTTNEDFKTVIEEGYLKNEAIRVVHAKAAPGCNDPKIQLGLENEIIGIGQLRQYFFKIMQFGNTAEVSLREARDTQRELEQENTDG